MESYLSLHRPQSQHRTRISESLGQNPRHSYSKTSTTHRALTLTYSRSRQNCSQSSSHSLYGQRSKVQVSDDSGTGGYRTRYRSASKMSIASASGSKSMCRLPISEPSYLMRSRSRPKTSISRQSTDVSSCDEENFVRDENKVVQRGRRQSRTAFAKMHERYRIRQDYSLSSPRNNIFDKPSSYGRRNQRPESPENDSGSDTDDFGGPEKSRLRFPDVPVNLNDSREFRELMNYTATVLGDNKKYDTQVHCSPPVLHEDFKDSNFSRTTSLSSINSAMWKHGLELETEDEDEWLAKVLGPDSPIFATVVTVDESETATSTATVQSLPEVQWWYDYVEPKAAKVSNEKSSGSTDETNKLQLTPSQNFGNENFIGASIAQKYRSRYRGMFNPSPRILDKTAHEHTLSTIVGADPTGSIQNYSQNDRICSHGTQSDHPRNLPVPSRGAKIIKRTLSPYISSAMAEFGSIGTDNSGNPRSLLCNPIPESTSEYQLENVYSGPLSNYSSIREAHKRREHRNDCDQQPDSVLKKSSVIDVRFETRMKNKSHNPLKTIPASQQPGVKYDRLDENHYDRNGEDSEPFKRHTGRNLRHMSELPCAQLPPLPDVILSDISLSATGLNSISEPDSLSYYGLTDTDDSARDSVSNIVLNKFIEDVAKSYPEELGAACLSETEDEEENETFVGPGFEKDYFGDNSFTNDLTQPLKPEKVGHIQTIHQQVGHKSHCLSKTLLADFDGHSTAKGETFSSYRSPGHMASYELYASEVDVGMSHVQNAKASRIAKKRNGRAQFAAICCPKNSTWSSKERNSFKPIHKTEEEEFFQSEEINENATEDSVRKGHLLPGGFEKAQVNVKGIITHNYEPLVVDETLSEQSDEEDAQMDDDENKGEQKSGNSETGKDNKQTGQTTETSDSPQTASTSQQATTGSSAATSASPKKKKVLSIKKSQPEDQNQNQTSKKTTIVRPKTSIPTNIKAVPNVKVVRTTQSAPAKVLISGLRNPRNDSGQNNSKPVPVKATVVPIKTMETVHREGKSPTKKGTKRSKKKKSETTAPNDDEEPVAGPSNASAPEAALPVEPAPQVTIVTNTITVPLFQGLPPPRPTLIHGTKLGKSQEHKSTRHVSIKLPNYAEESGMFEPSQNDENPENQDKDDGPSPSMKILIPTTNDAAGFRLLGNILAENPTGSLNYRSGSARPGTPGIPAKHRLQNAQISANYYTVNENSPSGNQKSAAVDENQKSSSPTSLRAKANQSGYFGLLMRQRKLTDQNGSSTTGNSVDQRQQQRLPISRNPQESLLPPPPMFVAPAPVEPIWDENPTTSIPLRIVEKPKTNVTSKGKSNPNPAHTGKKHKK